MIPDSYFKPALWKLIEELHNAGKLSDVTNSYLLELLNETPNQSLSCLFRGSGNLVIARVSDFFGFDSVVGFSLQTILEEAKTRGLHASSIFATLIRMKELTPSLDLRDDPFGPISFYNQSTYNTTMFGTISACETVSLEKDAEGSIPVLTKATRNEVLFFTLTKHFTASDTFLFNSPND